MCWKEEIRIVARREKELTENEKQEEKRESEERVNKWSNKRWRRGRRSGNRICEDGDGTIQDWCGYYIPTIIHSWALLAPGKKGGFRISKRSEVNVVLNLKS